MDSKRGLPGGCCDRETYSKQSLKSHALRFSTADADLLFTSVTLLGSLIQKPQRPVKLKLDRPKWLWPWLEI